MEFRILGPLEVMGDDGLLPLGSTKERVLLIRLVLGANLVVPIDTLVDDLWGDEATDQGPANLRVYVSRLRKRLAVKRTEVLVTQPPGYVLRVDPESVDAVRFERGAAEARRLVQEGCFEEASSAAEAALRLWRGPVLSEALGYAFARAEATRLEELQLAVIEDRIEADLGLGRHRALVGELASRVEVHPYRERLWGQLMLALYRAGRQAEALRAYERLRRLLAEDLGLSPGPDLVRLERAILEQSDDLDVVVRAPAPPGTQAQPPQAAPPTSPSPGAAATTPSSELASRPGGVAMPAEVERPGAEEISRVLRTAQNAPFVGRERELAALLSAWERARSGSVTVAMVAGEAGIGKTRLVREVCTQAWDAGAVVLCGRCDESAVVPYQPFVTAVRQLLGAAPTAPHSVWSTPGGLELARLVPGLAPPAADLVDHLEGDPGTRRYWLFEAFLSLLTEAAASAPVVLSLDDLHWADRATLRLLRHVLENAEPLPLLVVGTYRAESMSATLRETLAELDRVHPFDRVVVGGLGADGVEKIATSWLGRSPDSAVVSALHDQTDGNPFFLEEVLLNAGERLDSGLVSGEVEVPERIRDVIGSRVDRLPDEPRRLLEAAATIGRAFRLDLVGPVAGLEGDDLIEALEVALRAALVQEDGPGACSFVHALVRNCVYDQIGTNSRLALHRRIGTLLYSEHGLGPGQHTADIAYHLSRGVVSAADEPLALEALLAAGDRSLAQLAYEDAVRWYSWALELELVRRDDQLRCEIVLRLADAQSRAGQLSAARALLAAAAQIARDTGSGPLLSRVALAETQGPWAFRYTPQGPERIAMLGEALRLVGEEDPGLRCRLLERLAMELHAAQQVAGASRMATEAVELAQRTGDEELRFHALQADLVASLGPDLDPEEQLRRSREIVVLADRLSAGTSMLSATQLHQGALLQLGQIDAFCDGVELIADIADQLAMPAFSYWSLVYRTTIASLRGDFEEAEALAGRAFSAGQVIDESAALAIFGTEMIAISWAKGTLASLVDGAESLVRQFPRLPSFRAALTFMLAELGADGARESFDYFAAGRFAGVPRDDMWLMSMSMLSLACARLEDAEAAKVMLAQMQPYASRIVAPFTAIVCLGSAAAPIGLLARTAGRFDEADAYLAEAVERNLSLGATPLAALALWEQADCRRRMEDPAGFRRLAARSRQLAIESAMSGLLGRMAAEESLNS